MIGFEWSAISDPGQVRQINQDSAYAGDDVYILADGMGGHNAGEVASRWAVLLLHEQLVDEDPTDAGAIAAPVVEWANGLIHQQASTERDLAGMGTTVCALLVDRGSATAKLVNVGDSRGYRYRDGTLAQLTEDHSLVETLVREGRLRPEDAIDHPQRNIVTRALGVEADVLVDVFDVELVAGDRYLLCSDGLTDELTDEVISEVFAQDLDADATNTKLVEMANAAGGHDNITCVLIDVVEVDGGNDSEVAVGDAADGSDESFVGSVLEEDGVVATMPNVAGRDAGPQLSDRAVTANGGDAEGDRATAATGASGGTVRGLARAGAGAVGAGAAATAVRSKDGAATDPPGDDGLDGPGGDGDGERSVDAHDRNRTRTGTDTARVAGDNEPRSFPWRVPAFVLALLTVLGIGLSVLLFSGGDPDHYLGFDGEDLVIFKEDSGLFPSPDEQVEGSDLTRGELTPAQVAAIEAGEVRGTLDDVRGRLVEYDTVDETEGTPEADSADGSAESN